MQRTSKQRPKFLTAAKNAAARALRDGERSQNLPNRSAEFP
jgi:hypothetical protein